MKIIKDYLGHEIHKGDVVLYSEKGSRGYRGSFTEGVVVDVAGTIHVLDNFTKERYQRVLKSHEEWGSWGIADGKYANNVIDLTALGIRERIDLND